MDKRWHESQAQLIELEEANAQALKSLAKQTDAADKRAQASVIDAHNQLTKLSQLFASIPADISRLLQVQSEHDELLGIFDKNFATLGEGQSALSNQIDGLPLRMQLPETIDYSQSLEQLNESQKSIQQHLAEVSERQEQLLHVLENNLEVNTEALEVHLRTLGEQVEAMRNIKPAPAQIVPASLAAEPPSEEVDERHLATSAAVFDNLWQLLRRIVTDSVIANTLPSGEPRTNQSFVILPSDRQQFADLISMLPQGMRGHAIAVLKAFGPKGDRTAPRALLAEAVADVQESIRRYRGNTSSRCGSRQLLLALIALLFTGIATGIVFMPCGPPSVSSLQEAGLSHTGRGAWGLHV